jgi:NodT family efflux transporter outer membrane factor (OMF) lipoprotein
MISARSLLVVTVASVLSACAAGPNYHRPSLDVPATFKEAWQPAQPRDDQPRGEWWTVYGDSVLNDLEADAEKANPTIAAAEATWRSSRALIAEGYGALLPTVSASGSTVRSRGAVAANVPLSSVTAQTQDRTGLTASWEIDLWGKLRRGLESAHATIDASAGDLAAAKLSIAAQLATDYVQLRALDGSLALYATTLDGYRRSLQITRNRYAAGVAVSTDVTQAESTLATTEAQYADLIAQRAVLEHAIAVLTGRTPEALTLDSRATLPTLPELPTAMPASLLERRPDVAAAERRVVVANAQIGITQAAWFPTLSLTGTAGYSGSAWKNLFKVPAEYWTFGPQLAESILSGGTRITQSLQARANYDVAVANYRTTVLGAFQSVDDALANLKALAVESEADGRAAEAAQATLKATENQYRAGTVSYLNVVIAEGTALSANTALINVNSRRLQAHLALVKALGGAP